MAERRGNIRSRHFYFTVEVFQMAKIVACGAGLDSLKQETVGISGILSRKAEIEICLRTKVISVRG